MIYCRFLSSTGPQFGLVEADQITHMLPANADGLPDAARAQKLSPQPLASAKLLAPATPSKIICAGRNYLDHAKELGNDAPAEPLIFMKPPSSIIGPNDTVLRPRISKRVDFEGELAVIMSKRCRHLRDEEDVRGYIAGYVCANDVTARDLQKTDDQWTRAKGFDTFCPLGPIVNSDVDPWKGVVLETRVNGQLKQHGNTVDFIFPLDVLLRYISRVMTLLPGDLVLTGTPAGIAPVVAGDVIAISIEGLGTLKNPVADDPAA
jgi:2-keto-4-pentenoate hydratase/2-oxohepta-3-ene-1,7-dioic acid hydratase in catechol pathway